MKAYPFMLQGVKQSNVRVGGTIVGENGEVVVTKITSVKRLKGGLEIMGMCKDVAKGEIH